MDEVVTTGEARAACIGSRRGFEAGTGEPVYFGSHRRAQGVIVPVAVWEKLLEQAEDDVAAALVRARVPGEGGHRLTGADLDEAFGRAAEAAAHPTE